MLDAVVFDLDDTLCAYRRDAHELLAESFETVGVDPFFEVSEYYAVFDEYAREADDVTGIREGCFSALAEEAGRDPELGREVSRVYSRERDQAAVDPLPGALEALETLQELEVPLGLVTNGPPGMQSEKIDALGIGDHFEETVFAGFDTAAKPDPEPFERVLSGLDASPERAVHVGNSLETDVRGAANAGIRSVWLRREGAWGSADGVDVEPDHVLESMDEFGDLPLSGTSTTGSVGATTGPEE